MEFLHGRPMTNQTLSEPGMPARIAATLRVLHRGPPFLRDFDMLGLAEGYRAVIERRGFPEPQGYRGRRSAIRVIGESLGAHPLGRVPCHNDLLADNYIEQEDRLRLVDWEYSNGDPASSRNTCRVRLRDARPVCQGVLAGRRNPVARVHST
jgi:hypothetical protein